ncbi:DNA mismatch repair protein MutL [secondary endosymbiont of Trabutina mannipara]|uniref:DNA mismatch repair protein MutL n=1 Tax=secondary endosymbiont of Trabutina mannipara TaxID=1835721 RepID=A0A1C3L474_9ENTR|nr:DNA mismatch repair endonuclease MutL [secondary endosymbiont of Trabutina mannipara]SBT82077.1 DNA mismatch repair protein MutL [secondary endosymbiont of Trabutina mannipara]
MSIKVLPPHIANQIAAGEVVFRPASVVKEIIENSLDAGATRIEINIERGGTKRISIIDNGNGIAKEELKIALKRHSTSKITSMKDLENITSMGFRGEALNSISSVSRLTLTSRTTSQNEAWQVYSEGSDLAVTLKPAAHPVGTTIEVLDLFYNMPARRKFMRTEKTEFTYIDEIIRRMALSRFDVTFILQHNGKIVRNYLAVSQQRKHRSRMIKICGTAFVEQSLEIYWQHNSNIAIQGWISNPTCKKINMQYIYVNKRTIRNNKLIKNAVLQAYQEKITGTQHPAFVLFLDVKSNKVDINVHPTKNDVLFYHNRLIHDFIYQAVVTALQHHNFISEKIKIIKNSQSSGHNSFSNHDDTLISSVSHPTGWMPHELQKEQRNILEKPLKLGDGINLVEKKQYGSTCNDTIKINATRINKNKPDMISGNYYSFGRILTLIAPCYALLELENSLALLSLSVANRCLIEYKLTTGIIDDTLIYQPLLIPLRINLCKEKKIVLKYYQQVLKKIGFSFELHRNQATLKAVPLLFKKNLKNLITDLLVYLQLNRVAVTHQQIIVWITNHLHKEKKSVAWNYYQAMQLLADIELIWPQWLKNAQYRLLVTLNVETAIQALNQDKALNE